VPRVKLGIVGRDPLEQRYGLFIVLMLVARQADEDLKIARLGDEPALPARIGPPRASAMIRVASWSAVAST